MHAAFGPFAGFQADHWYFASCVIGNVAIAVAAAGYLGALVPGLSSGATLALATMALLWLIVFINLVSPRFVGQVEGLLLVAGLVPLVLVATAGWLAFDPTLFRADWNPGGKPILEVLPGSLVMVFWAFLGLESACVVAAVVDEPEKNVPRATVAGVLVAAAIYIVVSTVMMGLVPASELAVSNAPFALVATRMLGGGVGAFIAAAALLKALGTLAGWVLLTAQMSTAIAGRGNLPRAFARLRRGDIPAFGLVIAGLIGTVCVVLSISPTLGQQFGVLVEATTLFSLLTYIGACAAAMRGGTRYDNALALVGIAFCVVVIGYSAPTTLLATGAYVVLVLLVSIPLWLRRKQRP